MHCLFSLARVLIENVRDMDVGDVELEWTPFPCNHCRVNAIHLGNTTLQPFKQEHN